MSELTAYFRPTVSMRVSEDGSVAEIEFDWLDSFEEVVDDQGETVHGENDGYTIIMDRWTQSFPKIWRTQGVVWPQEAVAAVRADKKIQAIKELRATTHLSLKRAKDVIEYNWDAIRRSL